MPPAAERITSPQNPRLKRLLALRDRRERDELGLTLIEEARVVRRALAAGYPFAEVWSCPERLAARDPDLLPAIQAALAARGAAGSGVRDGSRDGVRDGGHGDGTRRGKRGGGTPNGGALGGAAPDASSPVAFFEITPRLLEKAAYHERSDGVIVVAPQVRRTLADLRLPERPLLLVLEAVEKPGNLGAILRTADAAGVDAVLVCEAGTDLFNPNVLRASVGAFFTVPTVEADGAAVRAWLRERGIAAVATTPAADRLHTELDLTGPTALVLGAEDKGLSDAWLREADARARLPMLGAVDSLNVGVTAAIVAYEAVRQRSIAPPR